MTVKVLQDRSFVLYILGSTITMIGDQALTIALALYMLKLTGSAAQFATVIAIGAFPMMVFGPISGSLADRFDKKIIIIGLDIFRGVLLTVIFLKAFISQPSEIEIYFVVLIISICESFYIPAHASITPNILDEDTLIQGNNISSMTTQISLVVAPAVAAMIYGILGISFIFLLDAITFLIIAIVMVFVKLKPQKNINKQNSLLTNILDGFKIFKNKEILSISLNAMLTNMLIFPVFIIGLPYLIKNVLSGTDLNYATVMTFNSMGAFLTFITVPLVDKFYKELKALNVCMLGMLGSIILMFLMVNTTFFNFLQISNLGMIIYFSTVAFLFELCFSTYAVFFTSFNQRKVDKQFLGRFYSILIMLLGLGRIIGSMLYGFLFDMNIIFYPIMVACIGMILKLLLNLLVTPNESIDFKAEVLD